MTISRLLHLLLNTKLSQSNHFDLSTLDSQPSGASLQYAQQLVSSQSKCVSIAHLICNAGINGLLASFAHVTPSFQDIIGNCRGVSAEHRRIRGVIVLSTSLLECTDFELYRSVAGEVAKNSRHD